MKTNRIIAGTVLACMTLTACEGMMDVHQKYVEGGEIVYLPPPLSTEFLAGEARVVVKMAFFNSPNVKSIDVYWNDGKDSLIYPVTLPAKDTVIYVPVPLADAKRYNFTVYSTDAYRNRSLPATGFGTAYDTLYQKSLKDLPVSRIALSEDGGLVQWILAEGLHSTEVRYEKRDGDDTTVTAPAVVNTLLPNVKTGVKMTYRSLFLPEPTAIDTFKTAWLEYADPFPAEILLDKARMTVVHYSDEEEVNEGGGAQMILNDDPTRYWHSHWRGAPAPSPHWLIVDMGKSRTNIIRMEITRRVNAAPYADAKTVEFRLGDNPDAAVTASANADWRDIGQIEFNSNQNPSYDMEVLTITPGTDTGGRYLLLYLKDSHREPFNGLSKLDIYTD